MKHYYGNEKIVELFKVLDSEPRLQVLKLLNQHDGMSMNELSERLGVTQGAVTAHIKALSSCGLISVREGNGHRGIRKLISLQEDRLMVDLARDTRFQAERETYIPIGSYVSCEVKPSCGLANAKSLIGQLDDPAAFKHPDHLSADVLWFASGYVEYAIPLPADLRESLDEIEISMEISSEAPGICEDWPSDITFILNGAQAGIWLSPGDFGEKKGLLNPSWWTSNWNQYGLLKQLSINHEGTYIDGLHLSSFTIKRLLALDDKILSLRMAVSEDSKNVGGFTLFGNCFGNYKQPIVVRFYGRKI